MASSSDELQSSSNNSKDDQAIQEGSNDNSGSEHYSPQGSAFENYEVVRIFQAHSRNIRSGHVGQVNHKGQRGRGSMHQQRCDDKLLGGLENR